jgi:peptide/nickel transport system ATP-binding protein
MSEALIEVENLSKLFPIQRGLFRKPIEFVHAVDGISFEIGSGHSLGLVGESGCGKSTTGRMLTRLTDASSGRIFLTANGNAADGNAANENPVDVAHLDREGMRLFRKRVQMIFQDPYESMNPRRTIFDTVAEPLTVQRIGTVNDREEKVAELLKMVGLTPPDTFLFRYPHELSGGQRQRVAIARALVINPSFVVADEPTSMLDVSIRISIMDLMLKLADELDVSYLYITHDLAVARYMCDRIAVMYLGKIVELAEAEDLLANPLHPYSRALLSAVPIPDPAAIRAPVEIKGGIGKAINPPPTCRFLDRCPAATDLCHSNEHPSLEDKGGGHYVACHLV